MSAFCRVAWTYSKQKAGDMPNSCLKTLYCVLMKMFCYVLLLTTVHNNDVS